MLFREREDEQMDCIYCDKKDFEELLKEMGQVLRNERLKKNMGVAEFSLISGIPASTISRYEKGERHIGIETLIKASKALKLDAGYVIQTAESNIALKRIRSSEKRNDIKQLVKQNELFRNQKRA